MAEITIRKADELTEEVSVFTDVQFSQYAINNGVDLNFEDFIFVAEDEDGKLAGVITGRAYYDEIHIGDLIIDKRYRGQGIGTKLVTTVEEEYRNRGFKKITLTTFGFQAPEYYKKLGYSLEFIREDKDPKLSKYFFCKLL